MERILHRRKDVGTRTEFTTCVRNTPSVQKTTPTLVKQTPKPATIKMSQPKFTEVITESTIFAAVTQEPFVTVKTESTISDPPSSSSNQPVPSPTDLIKQYDATFKEAEHYKQFV